MRRSNLHIAWTEHGGPPVKAPTRRGFGSTVIERSIPYDLKGEATLDYEVTGVRATFMVPASYVRPAPGAHRRAGRGDRAGGAGRRSAARRADRRGQHDHRAGRRKRRLMRAGIETVRVAASVAQAMKAIDTRAPDFALLDINLGRETSFAIAEHLASLGIRSSSRPATARTSPSRRSCWACRACASPIPATRCWWRCAANWPRRRCGGSGGTAATTPWRRSAGSRRCR